MNPSVPLRRPARLLVCGGAGFIGTNFIRLVLAEHPETIIFNLDALTYAGGLDNLAGLDELHPGRHVLVRTDIRDRKGVAGAFALAEPDTVVNFAAESHVDRSIDDPILFVETNVLGTAVLLEAARRAWGGRSDVRFHQVSTDEVYGSLGPDGLFREDTPYDPSSPYSASKAGADHLVRAWSRTYGLPVSSSNCSNNYGPWQFPEKLIPLMLVNALEEKPLPVYGEGGNIRDWLHVEDHCRAVWDILTLAPAGSSYNIGGGNEWTNLELVRLLCSRLDRLRPRRAGGYADLITFVADRPGHDARYAVDGSRLRRELGWRPRFDFDRGLDCTIAWYLGHGDWLRAIREKKYAGGRLGRLDREAEGGGRG
ncbi:MAG: dTDP-glucose 4,6-dehydratase [Planctomycetota bacterium]|jgi:dTDP-glucose 4,6-dehydratase|nr:dTDP-glucose 4,6-dehydratase [Planctomycetota bacterium]